MSVKCRECENEYDVIEYRDIPQLDDNHWSVIVAGSKRVFVRKFASEVAEDPFKESGDTFLRFDIKLTDAEQMLARQVYKGKRHGVRVSLYRHSGDIWYRQGSRQMPDEQWDVVHAAAVLIPHPDSLRYWRKLSRRKNGKSVAEQVREWADSELDRYSAYCNGWFVDVAVSVTEAGACVDCVDVERLFLGPFYFNGDNAGDLEYIESSIKEMLG